VKYTRVVEVDTLLNTGLCLKPLFTRDNSGFVTFWWTYTNS